MARTTIQQVREIIDTNLADLVIQAYINAGNLAVTNVLSGSDLSSSTLTEIERWMTAHMIASTKERQASEEKLGEAQIKYTGQFGQGLKSTTYGQMVLMLDTSGLMSNSDKRSASLKAIISFDD